MRKTSSRPLLSLAAALLLLSPACLGIRRPSLRVEIRPTPGSEGARPTFYLLDVDPIYFVMKGGDGPSARADEVYGAHPRLKVLAGLMNARRQAAYSLGPDVFLLLDQSRPLWEQHVIKSAGADDSGGALIEDLKAGDYWLMALIRERGREAFWLRRVTVAGGANEVVLEGREALYSRQAGEPLLDGRGSVGVVQQTQAKLEKEKGYR